MADPSATDTARGAALPARSWPPLPTSSEPTAEGREAQIDPTLDEDVKRLVERSTAAQGLPFHVQDPAILARVSKKAAHDVLGDRPADLAGTRRR